MKKLSDNPATALKQLLREAGVQLEPYQLATLNRWSRFCRQKVKLPSRAYVRYSVKSHSQKKHHTRVPL